jgi:hypothetical protein
MKIANCRKSYCFVRTCTRVCPPPAPSTPWRQDLSFAPLPSTMPPYLHRWARLERPPPPQNVTIFVSKKGSLHTSSGFELIDRRRNDNRSLVSAKDSLTRTMNIVVIMIKQQQQQQDQQQQHEQQQQQQLTDEACAQHWAAAP